MLWDNSFVHHLDRHLYLLPILLVLIQETRAVCRIEGNSCDCVEESSSQDDSLSNILAYCCQSDIFQVHIRGSRIVGGNAFYQKPCHNLIDFRIHGSSQTSLAPNGLAFNGLPNLEILHITGDQTLSVLPESVFSGLSASLRQLNLSNNALSSLTGSEFSGAADPTSRLEVLDLSNNQLTSLPGGCFRTFKGIRVLSLAGNTISELRPDMFTGLELLEELDLRRNPISVIIGGTFQSLSKLRKLLISGLHSQNAVLTTLSPGMLYGLHSLRHLEISKLGISSINAETFMELRHLQELDLSGNQLTHIPSVAFKRMVLAQRSGRFQRLNLSNNRIACLPDGAFSQLPQLKYLDLSGNLLTVISGQVFRGVKQLRDLNLLENPLLVIIPSAFDEIASTDDNGMRDPISILHRHRLPGELLPKKTVVRIPNDENIVGINKLRLRTVYGPLDDSSEGPLIPFFDISCPRLPLPNHVSSKRSATTVQIPATSNESVTEVFSGFLAQNKISLIIIVVCAVLTLIVTSATILSCQSCRKKRQRRHKTPAVGSDITSPPASDAGKSHYSGLSKQNTFSYNSLEARSTAYSDQLPAVVEKMSTSERLFNLGQQLAPPPYPHNLQTMEERLRQVAAANATPSCPFNSYITSRESPHLLQSGQSSPSNLGSSPRFSSSTSSVQQQRQKAPPGLHLIMTTSVTDHEKSPPPPPSSVSPLHESGIVSDNASSSLVTALGVF